jgi:Zn-finger nucleic acid-binding protein
MAEGMRCPVDGTALVMSERQNIEIDYCPSCRGVWLDRGELDKIIERSAAEAAPAAQPAAAPPQGYAPPRQPYGDPYRGHDPHYGHRHHKRRKSFLEELFD